MKLFKKCLNIFYIVLIVLLFLFTLGMQTNPEKTSQIMGFRFYTILSDSMEPTIPTYSLVFSKVISSEDTVLEDEIITFKTNLKIEPHLLTHYYRDIQIGPNGKTYYRTQPEGIKDQYDPYYTSKEDIVGSYLFHIPYLGKVILFLQSKFIWIYFAELLIIFLINLYFKTKWEEESEEKQRELQTP